MFATAVSAVRPLDGVRVIDLTRLLPGSYATLLLADLGADVVKVEDPRGGDHARHMPPLAGGTSVYFHVLNRNKRSVTLDLRSAAATPVLDALLSTADIVVDSFRPRTARRLGVDAERLRASHPRLICASITGFGRAGPYVDRAAHDINYEALAGLLSRDAPPRVPGLLIGDVGAAMHATAGILAALFQRERTGGGATIDVSIHEAALSWMLFPSARWLVDGADADPRQLPLRGEAARYNLYETRDGKWLALGALEEKFWTAFCERIGRPDLKGLHDVPDDAQRRALDEVRALMRTRTRDQWLSHFAELDVCLTPVNSLDEALADPHAQARGVVTRRGGTTYITPPGVDVSPAPALGEHTDQLLEAVGVDRQTRERLRSAGVI